MEAPQIVLQKFSQRERFIRLRSYRSAFLFNSEFRNPKSAIGWANFFMDAIQAFFLVVEK